MHTARLKSATLCACLMNHVVIAFSPMQKGYLSSLYPNTSRKKQTHSLEKLCIRICLYGKWTSSETAASFSSTVSSITCIAHPELLSRDGGQLQQRRLIQAEYMFLNGPQNFLTPPFVVLLIPKNKNNAIQTRPIVKQWSAPNRTKPRSHVAPSLFDVYIIK